MSYKEVYQLVENNYNTILTNNEALLSYQPKPLPDSVEVLLFHATEGFIASDNIYGMPKVGINIEDRSNGFKPYRYRFITEVARYRGLSEGKGRSRV
jgi:polyketide synthase PksM